MTRRRIEELDELIAWFEKNNPKNGQVIRMNVGPKTLARMLNRFNKSAVEHPREQEYKGRTVIATGSDIVRTP